VSNNGKTDKTNTQWAGKRWQGVTRPYTSADVERIRGSIKIDHTLARMGAERLWELLHWAR
jgi:isocitrate lyase